MKAIEVAVTITAPVEDVWADIARLESHEEWMIDAETISFLPGPVEGPGTRIEAWTRLGPFRTKDVIEVVEWEPPHRIAVLHTGVVKGTGQFLLQAKGNATRFTWREEIHFPMSRGGRLAELVAAPLLAAVWGRNLGNLAARFD